MQLSLSFQLSPNKGRYSPPSPELMPMELYTTSGYPMLRYQDHQSPRQHMLLPSTITGSTKAEFTYFHICSIICLLHQYMFLLVTSPLSYYLLFILIIRCCTSFVWQLSLLHFLIVLAHQIVLSHYAVWPLLTNYIFSLNQSIS